MHLCQSLAHGVAMRGGGLKLRTTRQAVDHSGRFIRHRKQNLTFRVGLWRWHGNALIGQMFHEVQIKRQLFTGQPLKQGQHILALCGGEEIIGVFNAAADARQRDKFTHRQLAQQFAGLLL